MVKLNDNKNHGALERGIHIIYKIFLFYLFLLLVSLLQNWNMMFLEVDMGFTLLSSSLFITISLWFYNPIYNKVKVIFSKQVFLFMISIYITLVSINLYEAKQTIKFLERNQTFKESNISYSYENIFISLRPMVRINLENTYQIVEAYNIAKKLFHQPYTVHLTINVISSVEEKLNLKKHEIFFHNYKNKWVLFKYLFTFLILSISIYHFLTIKFFLRKTYPTKQSLVFWLLILMVFSFMTMIASRLGHWSHRTLVNEFPENQEVWFKYQISNFRNENIIQGDSNEL